MKKLIVYLIVSLVFGQVAIVESASKVVAKEKEESHFYNREDAVFSSNGSIGLADKAYSPDKKYYVCEVEPECHGNIAVFEVKTLKQIQKWTAMPVTIRNNLKGIAWSPDSKRVAVMYHGGRLPLIQVFELGKDFVVAIADGPNNYHYMVFDKDGKTLLLAGKSDGQVFRFEPKKVK